MLQRKVCVSVENHTLFGAGLQWEGVMAEQCSPTIILHWWELRPTDFHTSTMAVVIQVPLLFSYKLPDSASKRGDSEPFMAFNATL